MPHKGSTLGLRCADQIWMNTPCPALTIVLRSQNQKQSSTTAFLTHFVRRYNTDKLRMFQP